MPKTNAKINAKTKTRTRTRTGRKRCKTQKKTHRKIQGGNGPATWRPKPQKQQSLASFDYDRYIHEKLKMLETKIRNETNREYDMKDFAFWKTDALKNIKTNNFEEMQYIFEDVFNTVDLKNLFFEYDYYTAMVDNNGSIISTAARENNTRMCEYLVSQGTPLDFKFCISPLIYACYHHNVDLVRLFLENGANPNMGSRQHISNTEIDNDIQKLSYSAYLSPFLITLLAYKKSNEHKRDTVEILKLLIHHGLDIFDSMNDSFLNGYPEFLRDDAILGALFKTHILTSSEIDTCINSKDFSGIGFHEESKEGEKIINTIKLGKHCFSFSDIKYMKGMKNPYTREAITDQDDLYTIKCIKHFFNILPKRGEEYQENRPLPAWRQR